ncbi:hypothetical protein Spock_98 [Bacillus phage Spock]|uniref:Uncharacterized protein n=1 Tax=Bacillus phage Spock TaxID=1406791 RepID=U5Q0V2_9CAUD|nr:hypothetical protein Spock_98 [Bacillus phage Spock]AGY48498.1 hypothetical protein Spock_98 [Bacillus phage Spock]
MVQAKPATLVRFISTVTVLPDGTIPFNTMNEAPMYVSQLYKPVFSLSSVARLVLDQINQNQIPTVDIEIDPRTLVRQIMDSDLATYNPRMYTLVTSVVLESFAILYSIETESTNLQYLSQKDFQRIRENVNYIADYFSTVRRYRKIIESLRITHVSLGYLENQIDVILTDRLEVR